MWLITCKIWDGPSKDFIRSNGPGYNDVKESLETFASDLTLNEALTRIIQYEKAFNEKYTQVRAVNITLLIILEMPYRCQSNNLIQLRVKLAENLPQTIKDFE